MALAPTRIVDGPLVVDKDVPIETLDGTVLRCNVFRPNRDGRFPPVVSFTPYGKDSDVAVDYKRYWDVVLRDHPEVVAAPSTGKYLTWEVPDPERWVPDGYAVVVVDARGTGKSPGFFDWCGPIETRDLYDVIEWAGRQDWSNGNVGLLGVSYLAIKQWQVAALQPPHLKAMIPWEGMFDQYRDLYRHGGIFSSAFLRLIWETQIEINQNGNAASPYRDRFDGTVPTGEPIDADVRRGNALNVYELVPGHPFDDAWYHERTPRAERIRVPFLSAGNWGGLGLHLRGNVVAFEQAASPQKWLELHTDTHFASMYLPEAVALQKRFFGHFLKGEDNGWDREPPVLVTVRDPRGATRRREAGWPLPGTHWTRLWLDAGAKALVFDAPKNSGELGYEALGDGLTFRSAAFAEDAEFTGPVAAKMFVSSSTTDLDIFLTLRLFDPAGNEATFTGANDPKAPVTQGWLRASHRKVDPDRSTPYRPFHPHQAREPLEPGAIYELDVELWPTSVVCPRGYSLALTVGGRDFERPDATGLMKGSGLFLHDHPGDRPPAEFGGHARIITGPEHPSSLLLPLVRR